MSTVVEWYPPNGLPVVTFGPDFPYRLQEIEGLENTLVQGQSIKSPSQHGVTLVDLEVPARVVVAQVLMGASDMPGLWATRRVLAQSLSGVPARVGEDVQMGTLRVLRDGFAPVEAKAFARDSPKLSRVGRAPIQVADIEWEAPYPFWKDVADTQLLFQAAGAGLQFPINLPLDIEEFNVQQEVNNLGDVDAPLFAELWGDMTTVRLLNDTTDEVLEITGNIPSGDHIEVNTAFGEKAVTLVTAAGVRTSILDRVNLAKADFWSLRPGSNVVRFEADTNTSGYAVLYWRPRYAGV